MRRWLVFNGVGLIGFVVQLTALTLLLRVDVQYLAATAAAVELAILHNFAWHERLTWRDRPAGPGQGRRHRLWRFHAANGVISIVGNLVIMQVLVGLVHLPAVPANVLSVLLCALVNFTASDRFVFGVT